MSRVYNKVFILTAVLAALSIIAIASCTRSKEQAKGQTNGQTAPAAEQLPMISTLAELDTAMSRADDRMLVLDFYADWCRPCRTLAPTIGKIAVEFKGRAYFYRINVDTTLDLSRSFGVQGIPYIVFMKKRKAVFALTGINSEESYRKILTICDGVTSPEECTKQLNEKM